MDQNTFLYTIPQWFIFASIIAMGYGWVEKKKAFGFIGIGMLIALGLFAAYAVISGYFVFNQFLSPEEIMYEDLLEDEFIEDMPLIGRILPAYWLFIASGIAAIPTMLLEWKKKKAAKTFMIISALIALAGFFIIVSALRV